MTHQLCCRFDVDTVWIEQALQEFDEFERSLPTWKGWTQRANYKFAVAFAGRTHPVKRIIALATGASESHFSGGEESNIYLVKRRLTVTKIREDVAGREFQALLRRIAELQLSYSYDNTPEMQERGERVRRDAPTIIRGWLPDGSVLEVKGKDGTCRKTKVPWSGSD